MPKRDHLDLGTPLEALQNLTSGSVRYECMRIRRSWRPKALPQIKGEASDRDQALPSSVPAAASGLSVSGWTVGTMIAGTSSNLPSPRTVRLGSRDPVPREALVRVVDRLEADAGWRMR